LEKDFCFLKNPVIKHPYTKSKSLKHNHPTQSYKMYLPTYFQSETEDRDFIGRQAEFSQYFLKQGNFSGVILAD